MSISVEATGKYYTTQTTDFHFANYRFSFRFVPFRFVSFRFASFRFANYSKPFKRWIALSTRWKSIQYKTQSVSLTLIIH